MSLEEEEGRREGGEEGKEFVVSIEGREGGRGRREI